jgi:hypothetical protein
MSLWSAMTKTLASPPASRLGLGLMGLGLCLTALAGGYLYGHSKGFREATALLEARYAQNLAEAYREAAIKQVAESIRANALAVELLRVKRALETGRAALRERIIYVTREIAADCLLPADAVQLWNEAWGLSAPNVPQADGSGGAAGQAAAPGPAEAGLQQGASIADALAWQIDAGAYCRSVEAQRDQLQELAAGWIQ